MGIHSRNTCVVDDMKVDEQEPVMMGTRVLYNIRLYLLGWRLSVSGRIHDQGCIAAIALNYYASDVTAIFCFHVIFFMLFSSSLGPAI